MATVTNADGTKRTVKNLGWLLRHARQVMSFNLKCHLDGTGTMTARLQHGLTFEILWCDSTLMVSWLIGPSFRDTPATLQFS